MNQYTVENEAGEIILQSRRDFCKKHAVCNIIRIPLEYFPKNLLVGERFTHIFLNNRNHVVGKQYLLIAIRPRSGMEPVLIEKLAHCVRCIEYESDVCVDTLNDFQYAPRHLDSQEKMRKWIEMRYLHRNPQKTLEQLLADKGGVAKILLEKYV